MIKSFSIVILMALIGCVARPVVEQQTARSGLSDVLINVPKGQELKKFLGEGCKDFKATPQTLQRLGVTNHCDAATKLLDGFQLTLKMESCEAGIKADSTTMVGLVSKIKPKDKVVKGCTYSVLMEL